ncbi:hypothetical protein F4803DRAFT_554229 [Xylaria telfairii]|nr:hypothetical protein F4803DRAFT_554229 [Xylaria telfairii]
MSLGKWSFRGRNRSTASSGKSDISSSSSSSSSTTRTSSPANNRSSGSGNNSTRNSKTSSSSSSSSSRLSWFRSSNRSKRKSIISRDDPAFARLHKPFTPQNLEHQKMLSTFEWTFDDDDDSACRRRQTSLSISPCASRNATVDDYAPVYDYGYGGQEEQHSHNHALPPNGHQNTISRPFAGLSMREGSGEDLDLENTI